MKTRYLLSLLPLAYASMAMAGPVNGVDWDCPQNKIVNALRQSSDATIDEKAIHPKDIVSGGFSLNKKHVFQTWKGYFKFDPKTSKLSETLFIGSEGFDADLLDGPLKSYYLFVAEALKSDFKLAEKAKNLPHYGDIAEVGASDFYPLHSYTTYDKFITLGWALDKKTNKIHAAFTVKEAAIKTGLGIEAQNPNVKGTEKEWEKVTLWTDMPEADEFLIMAGLKVVKQAPASEETKAAQKKEASDMMGIPVDEDEVDEAAEMTQASIESIDKSLSADDQALLLAICEEDNGNEGAYAKHLIVAAQASNARALYRLGQCFETGRGIAKNEEKAKQSMLAAAQMGYAPALVKHGAEFDHAMAALGYTEAEGAEVIKELEKAAQAKSVSARMSLALMYRYGFGVRKDVDKARTLLEGLELQGDLEASALLNQLF